MFAPYINSTTTLLLLQLMHTITQTIEQLDVFLTVHHELTIY